MKTRSGKLVITGGISQEFELESPIVTIGRQSNNDIVLSSGKISRTHVQIERDGEKFVLTDLDSANGVKVNGALVKRAVLNAGDLIAIGNYTLRYEEEFTVDEAVAAQIDSLEELENTLAATNLDTVLMDTHFPRLAIQTSERTWEYLLADGEATIGRSASNDIPLPFARVSRNHAVIERRGDKFFFRDLGSSNGSFIHGQRIETAQLHDGTTIKIGPAKIVFKPGFEAEELTLVGQPTSTRLGERRPVVFVPGLMGSQLWLGSEQLWPNVRSLFRDPEILKLPGRDDIEPRGLVHEVVIVPNLIKQAQYNRLGDYLVEGLGYGRGRDFLEFAYDWRDDIRNSARRLGAAIEAWDRPEPVTIIGHSLGCLVSRYYINCLGGDKKVERVILLGGPHQGAPKAITAVMMRADLLPFGAMGERLRDILRTYPSFYQILPTYPCVIEKGGEAIDLFSYDEWLPEAQRPMLRYGREYWREVGKELKVPSISIFGYGQNTITGINVELDLKKRWLSLGIEAEDRGDETVPEYSAVLVNSEIHPVQQNHGSLYVDNDVKMRLKYELTRL